MTSPFQSPVLSHTLKPKKTGLVAQIDALKSLDRAELAEQWQKLMKSPLPARLSAPLLRRYLAYELQCKVFGLPKAGSQTALGCARPQASLQIPGVQAGPPVDPGMERSNP